MKKILCFILVMILCLTCVGCSNKEETAPLKLINEVEDKYGNILAQIYYNEDTGEYIIEKYSYMLQQDKWVCIDQQTIIDTPTYIPEPNCPPYPDANYYGPDLGMVYTY
jgi:hypothetical protein